MGQYGFEEGGSAFELWCKSNLAETGSIGQASRGGGGTHGEFDARQFDQANVLGVHFTDGSVFYTDPRSFSARYVSPSKSRSEDAGVVRLPFTLHPGVVSRGAAAGDESGARVERYSLTRLEAPSALDRLYEAGAELDALVGRWLGERPAAAALLALKICRAFENSALQHGVDGLPGGLLEWERDKGWKPLARGELAGVAGNAGVLVFLHGTASSTSGSFKGLWSHAAPDDDVPAQFERMGRRYAKVLAFEHRSLTGSPIENARDLAAMLADLPKGTRIDLVSHSRGGMVGELLCLSTLEEEAFGDATRAFCAEFREPHPDADVVPSLLDNLETMAKRDLRVRTFVRVACPARGTLLADRRTDLFVSLLARAVGLAFGVGGVPAFDLVAGLAKGLVAARADAKALPGLEGMVPGSRLTRALNLYGIRSSDRLRVIAGDSEGMGWGGITTLLADVFYGLHDHDFVVHTRSMFGGFERRDAARSLRVQGRKVTHFSYFKEASSREALFVALAGEDAGFSAMVEDEKRTRGLLQAFARDPLCRRPRAKWLEELDNDKESPVLIVLPGIMGSELSRVDGDSLSRLWIDPAELFTGRAAALEWPDRGGGLVATGLLPAAYERLLRQASESGFRVVPFPFDWRAPIPDSADDLNDLIEDILKRTQRRPIHLIAHSMGGLVARWASFQTPKGRQQWEILRRRGSRLLMLGTPNRGSYAPVRAALERHDACLLLGDFSRDVDRSDVAGWCAGFPGLMQMLPWADDASYGSLRDAATWRRLCEDDKRAHAPDVEMLGAAREFADGLESHRSQLLDDQSVFYVAGAGLTDVGLVAPPPAASRARDYPGEVAFRQDWAGDGTVSWASTLAPERTWYVDAGHGALSDTVSAFEAYFDLLRGGRTDRLRQHKPAVRGGEPLAVTSRMPPSLPTGDDFESWILGLTPTASVRPEAINVKVVFASLDYARYPLMVGHYLSDHIVSAERRVDEKLNGQLSTLLALGLYPGARNTSVYVRPNRHDGQSPAYPGAIIVGLDNIGQLTPASLADTVARAVLRYAFEHRHRDAFAPREVPEDLRLSTLLIGSHAQAVTMRDSLAGVLQGIWRAAQVLAHTPELGQQVRVREVEFIEMWEQRAFEAACALRELLKRSEWRQRFLWEKPLIEERDGGLAGHPIASDRDWWQRLVVRENELGGMSYALIADKARVEATQVSSDLASMRAFMEAISDGSAQTGGDNPQMSRVLYEMLLPNDLKTRLANFDDTVIVVDDATAVYPWELLTPPLSGAEGSGEEPLKPLAVQAGFLRQRVVEDFRRLPETSIANNVLVIGAPDTSGWRDERGDEITFSTLKGARDEAMRVTDMLRADPRDWQITKLIGDDVKFGQVRIQLLANPYRILHLCGHGVTDQWLRTDQRLGADVPVLKTGMVLSDQQILGASEIEQMSVVPALVFINCCYGGRDGKGGAMASRYPVLASSIAMKLISNGAKAVIAAGWRIDDEAALAFTERFYEEILGGQRFGEAVRAAREYVHGAFGHRTNTWGAYQCYGDPDWSLEKYSRRSAAREGSSHLGEAAQSLSHRELALRVERTVAVAGDKPRKALLAQLDRVVADLRADDLRKHWLESSTSVRAALGEAYRELGDHASAVRWFMGAASDAYSQLKLRQVEYLANSLSRLPAQGCEDATKVIDWLASAPRELRDPAKGTASAELVALRGSVALRHALDLELGTVDDRVAALQAQHLREACLRFAEAWVEKSAKDDFPDRRAFALSNFLLSGVMSALNLHGETSTAQTALHALLAEAVDPVPEASPRRGGAERGADWVHAADRAMEALRNDEPGTFWDYTNRVDLAVARCLFNEVLSPDPAIPTTRPPQEVVLEAEWLLDAALVRWPSPRELDSLRARYKLVQAVVGRRRAALDDEKAEVLLWFARRTLELLDRVPASGD